MTNYDEILLNAAGLIEENTYDISILANISALLFEKIENINWAGFYINKNNTLLLGPFQGKVACTTIPFNKGVCGACATSKETIIVDNVHEFKGHIACDSASNSEICIPILVEGDLYGLLDIDSPLTYRFNENDRINLEKLVILIQTQLKKTIFK